MKSVVDATLLEQQCSEGDITVGANAQGELVLISKMGGIDVDALTLLRCIEIAMAKIRVLGKVVAEALEKNAQKRDQGSMRAELSAENDR